MSHIFPGLRPTVGLSVSKLGDTQEAQLRVPPHPACPGDARTAQDNPPKGN